MSYCLWCYDEIIYEGYWHSFVNGKEMTPVCKKCATQLKTISGKTCQKCNRQSINDICSDCLKWQRFFNEDDPLERNISTFHYNDFLKDVIAKWKYRGDYVLVDMFHNYIKQTINKHLRTKLHNAIVVPIPLSPERLQERGFNQSLAIADKITHHKDIIQHVLQRVHGEKQSKKTRTQRIFGKNPFKLIKKTNKSVILVDDIYTTGTTLRHAATLLKQSGCPAIYSYSLIRG